jgi:hypothetical protein
MEQITLCVGLRCAPFYLPDRATSNRPLAYDISFILKEDTVKKTITVFIAVAILLCVTACGGDGGAAQDESAV